MSISRQLFILISLLFLIIFGTNYITGLNNIKEYLQTEAIIHAENTAASLGISLQPHIENSNDTIIPTLVNAVFDKGYYGEITLVDVEDTPILERKNPSTFQSVPTWFSNLLVLETAVATSEINSGWNIAAKVIVSVHPGYAYLKLWNQAKRALSYSAMVYMVSLLVLAGVLRLVMKPLQKIEQQAVAIGDGQFLTITPLPWTKEIKSVAIAMNLMSGKIKQIITSMQSKLVETERKLTTDNVTGLDTKPTFDATLKQLFMSKSGGYVFLLRIDELGEFAKSKASDDVDNFLRDFASCIKEISSTKTDAQTYRLGGSEFAIIAESISSADAEQLCKGLTDGFTELGQKADKPNIGHIGCIAFDPLGTPKSIMSGALESYNKARLVGLNSFVIGQASATTHTKEEWVALVKQIVEKRAAEIVFSDRAETTQGPEAGQLVLEEATAKVYDDTNNELSIGTFISVADELGLVTSFDHIILQKVIDYLNQNEIKHDVAVNLSFASIADPDFRSQLYNILKEHEKIATHLVFCLTAYAAAKDMALLTSFKMFIQRTGAKLMIKRFEPRFMPLEVLKEYNFNYIRLARNFTEDIAHDAEKKNLITTMIETGNLLDTTILAEAVDEKNWQQVVDLGIHGASRKSQ